MPQSACGGRPPTDVSPCVTKGLDVHSCGGDDAGIELSQSENALFSSVFAVVRMRSEGQGRVIGGLVMFEDPVGGGDPLGIALVLGVF